MGWMIGVDIGGTFADFAAMDLDTGRLETLKVLTTPDDAGREVGAGLQRMIAAELDPAAVERFVHRTTVGVNTIIPRRGSRLAEVWMDGQTRQAGLYRRADLKAGQSFPAQAVVTQYDCTTVVPPRVHGRRRRLHQPSYHAGGRRMSLDNASLQVLANYCAAAAASMGWTLMCTAHSIFVKETEDFSCQVLTPDGLRVASPRTFGATWYAGLDYGGVIGAFDYREGDICITSDPYAGSVATHMPNVHMWQPVFRDGALVCFVGNHIHNADVGGAVPATLSRTLTEIHQEGPRIPPMRLVRDGVMNEDLLRNTPVEINEAEVPIRIHRCGLVPDTGGAGRWRGGSALEMAFQVFAPQTMVTARNRDRSVMLAWGLAGGQAGATSRFARNQDGAAPVELGSQDGVLCEPGDVLTRLLASAPSPGASSSNIGCLPR